MTPSINAFLGPTNTGKTHRAIERMLEHASGSIGLPLRLLAREVYDKISARCGESQVALVTGEEKRIPKNPRYWVSTVEAMPLSVEVDFLAIDEVQLAAHVERGHVFTDRLLHARGRIETWLLGAETMRGPVSELVPGVVIEKSPRLSSLSEAGSHTLATLPRRSAVVAFSLARVFELAALLRKRRGGTAVVIGALSPRARNAQVALYQAGEVDFLVATDAIGMGLNLDIDHVAFADVRKFDGREARSLELAELGQIAGRAGRYTRDGTFGTLSPLAAFSAGVTAALEQHRFEPIRRLYWRSSDLDFSDVDSLRASLAMRSSSPWLRRADDPALDAATLEALSERAEVRARAKREEDVRLLWSVCGLPDYRQLLFEDHAGIALKLFTDLADHGTVELDWVLRELERLDEPADDPETLMARIAQLRTWNYVAHQPGWLAHPRPLQQRAASMEDSLSDALHRALVARFVDRTRKMAPKAAPSEKGRAKPSEPGKHSPFAALAHLIEPRNGSFEGAPDETRDRLFERAIDASFDAFTIDRDAGLVFEGTRLGRLTRGRDLLSPEVVVVVDTSPGMKLRLSRRLLAWSRDLVSSLVGSFRDLDGLGPSARGVVHSLTRRLGTVLTSEAREQLAHLDEAEIARLEQTGLVLGKAALYSPLLLKPAAIDQRVALVAAYEASARSWPRGTEVSVAPLRGLSSELHSAIGYPLMGPRAVRADVLERFRNRLEAAREEGSEVTAASFAGWLGARAREAEEIRLLLFPDWRAPAPADEPPA